MSENLAALVRYVAGIEDKESSNEKKEYANEKKIETYSGKSRSGCRTIQGWIMSAV